MSHRSRAPFACIPSLIEEHFDELGFQWQLREDVVFAPDWDLRELDQLEQRAGANLDALAHSGWPAIDLALSQLASENSHAVAAGAFVLAATEDRALGAQVLGAMRVGEAATVDAVRVALRHSPISHVRNELREFAAVEGPTRAAAALDVLAFHGEPIANVHELLASADPLVLRRAFAAAGRAGCLLDGRTVDRALDNAEASVRRAALEAAAWSGCPGIGELCRARALDSMAALEFLGVVGEPSDVALLFRAADRGDDAEGAFSAIGMLGSTSAVPGLLERVTHDGAAGAASRAFVRITGLTPPRKPDGGDPCIVPPTGAEAVRLRDVLAAKWRACEHELATDRRWCFGKDVTDATESPSFDLLPLDARRDLFLRARARRAASAQSIDIERRARLQRR